jgi:hypothetical protein
MAEWLMPAIEEILFLGRDSFSILADVGPPYEWFGVYPRPFDAKADELLGKSLTQAWEDGCLESEFVKKQTEGLRAQRK